VDGIPELTQAVDAVDGLVFHGWIPKEEGWEEMNE